MRDWAGKRYWLVGASQGLGRSVALELSKTGAEVILSARDEEALHQLASELPGKSSVVPVDVSDAESVAQAAAAAGLLQHSLPPRRTRNGRRGRGDKIDGEAEAVGEGGNAFDDSVGGGGVRERRALGQDGQRGHREIGGTALY